MCVCVSVFVVVLSARWAAFDRFTDAELNNLEPFARHDSARETERDVARVSTGKNAATQIRTHTRTHTHIESRTIALPAINIRQIVFSFLLCLPGGAC